MTAGITTFLNSAEIYDPTSGVFTSTGNMKTGRIWFSATTLDTGNVLIAGGNSQNLAQTSAELYDTATGTFAYTAGLTTPRLTHTATTALQNNKVLFIGGANFIGGGTTFLRSAEIYDVSTGTMSSAGNLNSARAGASLTLLSDGSVLVAGGDNGSVFSNTAELYAPGTPSSTTLGSNMVIARYSHTATKLQSGSILLVGGSTIRNITNSITASAELYVATPSSTLSSSFFDSFDGTALQSNYWTPQGTGATTVSGGWASFACYANAYTKGKVTFSGGQILIETGLIGTGHAPFGRDTAILLKLVT